MALPFSGHWAIPCPPRLQFMRPRCVCECVCLDGVGGEWGCTLGSRGQLMNYRFAFGSAYSLAFKREAKWFNASEQVTTISSLLVYQLCFSCYTKLSQFICGHSVILCLTFTTSPVISDPVTPACPGVTPALAAFLCHLIHHIHLFNCSPLSPQNI